MGQFALVEITSSPGSARLVDAIRRLGLSAIAGLRRAEPDLADDVVFGLQAAAVAEGRLADHLSRSWAARESSLRG